MGSNIIDRTVNSVAWVTAANWAGILISIIQSIVLARLLPIYVFGNFAYASSIVIVAAVFARFGSGAAFTHRTSETAIEQDTAQALFTFKILTVSLAATVIFLGAYLLAFNQSVKLSLIVLTVSFSFNQLFIHIPRIILIRRVAHRRLAILQFVSTFLSAIFSIAWSFYSPSIWALLIGDLTKTVVLFAGFYFWQPIWRPKFNWDREAISYYFSYGGKNLIAGILSTLLDRGDDLWTGFIWGASSLGIYSRAYKFATYPRQIVAGSINKVIIGTYAELKDNPSQLSKVFFRTNAFLIRTGFFLAGLMALVAEEFIVLVLTEKWLPMLDVFRLMLIFTLLDPLKASVSHVFIAVGYPEVNIYARVAQIIALIGSLAIFYSFTDLNIIGVAISVNIMVVVGICILLVQAREYVHVPIIKLFFAPFVALFLAIGASIWLMSIAGGMGLVASAAVKSVGFVAVFALGLFLLERDELRQQIGFLKKHIPLETVLNLFSRKK